MNRQIIYEIFKLALYLLRFQPASPQFHQLLRQVCTIFGLMNTIFDAKMLVGRVEGP